MKRSLLDIPAPELNLLREFDASGVEYLLTGGHAMRFYGIDRVPKDVDVVTGIEFENAERLVSALERAIGTTLHFPAEALIWPKVHLDLRGYGLEVDLFSRLPGLKFEEAFAQRATTAQRQARLFIISSFHLLQSKRWVAQNDPNPERRQKEQEDVVLLERDLDI